MTERRTAAGWKILESEIAIQTPFLRLRKDTIELPDGTIVRDYYVRESRGFALIVPVAPDGRFVLIRQYKHGVDEYMLEFPAGAIDPGETPLACAIRELAEETGYVGEGDPELLGSYAYDPTSSNSYFHLYLARGARKLAETSFDATEEIEVQLATAADVIGFVRDRSIRVSSQVMAVYVAFERLGILRVEP
jgi:8-oxo-dGTP pyrophosphatase MutT (NUDIX family)